MLGTLAGATLAGYVQRSGDRRARGHAHRQEVARAVAEPLETIVRHREAHWLAVKSRRAGARETKQERTARATTRSTATVARDRVGLLVVSDPALLEAAEPAWRTAVDLHDIHLGPATDGRFPPEQHWGRPGTGAVTPTPHPASQIRVRPRPLRGCQWQKPPSPERAPRPPAWVSDACSPRRGNGHDGAATCRADALTGVGASDPTTIAVPEHDLLGILRTSGTTLNHPPLTALPPSSPVG
ncbi:hypothetical protein [Streptomyces achromogenes]|uniref:hypothetical protein n=1 Tax=Streptomyces achromogenes TaxID=67255 RepID=UPI0036BFD499